GCKAPAARRSARCRTGTTRNGTRCERSDRRQHMDKSLSEGPFGLKDRTAVVTGAAAGIGQAIALLFARAGARIVVADVNGDAAENTAHAIREEGGQALAVMADVSQEAAVAQLMDRA